MYVDVGASQNLFRLVVGNISFRFPDSYTCSRPHSFPNRLRPSEFLHSLLLMHPRCSSPTAFLPAPTLVNRASIRRTSASSRICPCAELVVRDRSVRRPPKWLLSVNHGLVGGALQAVDVLYGGDAGPWSRFWVLEVVARVPYFSFLCTLHLAESLGLGSQRVTELQRAHFAEADNEAAHLAIMSSLGGGSRWRDRFVAQHAAILYFWVNILAFVVWPSLAYHFSELVEDHAFLTYDTVLKNQGDFLRNEAPVPLIAREYYVTRSNNPRHIQDMYDVIEAIRDDEAEHANDLAAYCEEFVDRVPWKLGNNHDGRD